MTHDTPPKRIWAEKTGKWWLGGSVVHCAEYTLTSEVDALVAAALREAAKVTDRYIVPSLTPIMQISEIRLGQDAAAQKIQERILALIPQPAAAALDKLIAEAEARGMDRAAKLVDKRAEEYARDFGIYDHTTGVTEYPGTGAESMEEWESISEQIRSEAVAIRAAKGEAK